MQGGGAFNQSSSARYYDCLLFGNQGSQAGGGLRNNSSSVIVTNCTFSGNTGGYMGGGGVDNWNSNATYNNCIFWGNTAPSGNQLHGWGAGITTLNNSCYGNDANDVVFIETSSLTATNNNITVDPLFVDPTANDFRLSGVSPALDSGNSVYNGEPVDLRGFSRIQNTYIDMGAYEWTQGIDPQYLPNVLFQDGEAFHASVTNGYEHQALGQFALQTQRIPGNFTGVSIRVSGDFSGASNFQLWQSENSDFDASLDTLLDSADPRDSALPHTSINSESQQFRSDSQRDTEVNLEFAGFSGQLSSAVSYYFITCDVAGQAQGHLITRITDSSDLIFDNSTVINEIDADALSASEIVFLPPTIVTSEDYLPYFGEIPINTVSDSQSYTVWGYNLQGDINIVAPEGFAISLNEFAVDYLGEINLSPVDGIIDSTPVFVRFQPLVAMLHPGNIIHNSLNSNLLYVSVGGEGTADLSAPQNLRITLLYDTLILEWDEVPNATMYNIYESDSPDGEFILIDTTTTNFWLHWETASRKFYRVRAATGS